MCQFNTAVMAPEGNEALVHGLAKSFRLKWLPLHNPHVTGQLEPGETYFFTTQGMCDCGSEIGGARQAMIPSAHVPGLEQDIKKFRQRGWSEAKIKRRIAQQREDRERKKADWEARHQATGEELDRWVAFITSVIEQRAAAWIGVMHHTYRGGIESERITFTRKWERIDAIEPKRLHELEADVLLTFAKKV